jgi:thioredoxin 1
MKNAITVTDNTFEQEVLKSDLPTLVDLWAPWCGPCVQIGPVIEEIAGEYASQFKVTKLNIDENPAIIQKLGVRAIPTLLFYKDGSLRDRVVGTPGKTSIVAKLDALAESKAAA